MTETNPRKAKMSKLSFEYTLFQMREEPGTTEFSDLVVRLCMQESNCVGCDPFRESAISSVVNILHDFRKEKAELQDEPKRVQVAEDPEKLFLDECGKLYGNAEEFQTIDDSFWKEHWPLGCKWHPKELKKLARLVMGEREAFYSEMRRHFP